MRKLTVIICLFFFVRGAHAVEPSVPVKDIASAYFEVYGQRSDFERFLNFYASNAVVHDIIYGNEIVGKENIRKFFDWGRGSFASLMPGPILNVETQVVSGQIVITRGTFKAFEYDGKKMGPWQFLIWQQFDNEGRIVLQEDWINYTPKQIFVGG